MWTRPGLSLRMSGTASPGVIHVTQAGEIAAACTVSGAWFAASIDALPRDHPDARLVAAKCLIAGAILRGDIEGPYGDLEVENLARGMLEGDADTVL